MKILFSIILVFLNLIVTAQIEKRGQNNSLLVAFNSEQMLEKIGFENLMTSIFDQKRKINLSQLKKMQTIRKSLAAMYGAGIDFKRKIWISFQDKRGAEQINEEKQDGDGVYPIFRIPLANKQIVFQSLQNINNAEEYGEKDTIIENGNTTTIITGESLFVLNDKDLFITGMPSFNSYYDFYRGKTIRIDTIIVDRENRNKFNNLPDERYLDKIGKGISEERKKNIKEIDKYSNGKISRIYQNKKPEAKSNIVFGKEEAVKEMPAAISSKIVMDTAKTTVTLTPDGPKMVTTEGFKELPLPPLFQDRKGMDTLTRTEYLNDTMELRISYVEYTHKEMDSLIKIRNLQQDEKKLKYAANLAVNAENNFPEAQTGADITKMFESKADIAIYVNNSFGSYFGMPGAFTKMELASGTLNKNKEVAYLGFINFENGKGTMNVQSSCCAEGNSLISNFYYPVTDFWPAELNAGNFGSFRYHLNMQEFVPYLQKIFPMELFQIQELEKEGILLNDLSEIFEGEIAMSLGVTKSKWSDRKEPKMIMAFKLKDPAKAVELMNKIGSKDLDVTANYRFDVNGKYLLINTDGFVKPSNSPISTGKNVTPISVGNFGEIKIDIKGLINATAREKNKTKPTFKLVNDFFGKMEMVNFKTEDGNFTGQLQVDLGPAETNSLKNLITLFKSFNDAEIAMDAEWERKYEAEQKMRKEREQLLQNKKNTRSKRTTSRSTVSGKTPEKKKN
jgi:hypothetical protein